MADNRPRFWGKFFYGIVIQERGAHFFISVRETAKAQIADEVEKSGLVIDDV